MNRRLISPPSAPHRLSALLLFISALAAAWLLYLPESLHLATATVDRQDELLNIWILAWDHHALLHDPLHLYHANIFHPEPYALAYSENLLSTALFLLPLRLFTYNPILIHQIARLLTFPLAALGMFLLARRWRLTPAGAAVTGWIFAFAPMKMEELSRIQVLSSFWIPFAVLVADRLFESGRRRDALLLSLLTACQITASYYLGFFLLVLLALHAAARLPGSPSPHRGLMLWLGSLASAAVFVLPVSWPYLALHSERHFERPLAELCKYSADLLSYVNMRTAVGSLGFPHSGPHLFPGLIALILTAAALRNTPPGERNKALVRTAWLSVVAGFILSLGPELIIAGHGTDIPLPDRLLWYILPGFSGFRILWRAAILVTFGIALLAGAGWTYLSNRFRPARRIVLTVMILMFILSERGRWPVPAYRWPEPDGYPMYAHWLAEHDDVKAYALDPYDQNASAADMLYSTIHWRPTLNGMSGFEPPGFHHIKYLMDRFPTANGIRMLKEKGISHVVFLTRRIPCYHVRNIREECRAFPELEPVADFGDELIYRLRSGE